MGEINKQTASLMYAYAYKLVDANGTEFVIMSLIDNAFVLEIEGVNSTKGRIQIYSSRIGTDYHILARPMSDLTKEITIDGESFVPLVELAKIYKPNYKWYLEDGRVFGDKAQDINFKFEQRFEMGYYLNGRYQYKNANTPALFKKLSEWHMAYDLPAGSWKPIKD